VLFVPIVGARSERRAGRHRAEIDLTALEDIQACALPWRFPVLRCQSLHRIRPEGLKARLGDAPASLVVRAGAAMLREAMALRTENCDALACLEA
jgi:hypothetical protein